MPSVIVGIPDASGLQQLISGNPWSGALVPTGGVQLRLSRNASGSIYVGLSGTVRLNSGGVFLFGGSGLLDGMEVGPGDAYFIPKMAFPGYRSGNYDVYFWHDAAASGRARLYFEAF